MGGLLAAGLRLGEWARDARFERATARPELAQATALHALLRRNARTAFGREHGFGAIRTPAEFVRAVPVRDYEGFRPYVRRIVAGEPAVLTAAPVTGFATTSGTTGEPKLVPVTHASLARMSALVRLWMRRALQDHPTLLDHAVLSVVSPAIEGRTATGIPFGAMSGLLQQGLPFLVRRGQAVPYAAHLVTDYEARAFVLLRLALARHVTAIGTPNPMTLIRLAAVARQEAEALLRAIHDGTLGIPWPTVRSESGWTPEATRRTLAAALRPDPARARALAAAASRRGALRLADAWPTLALVGCWLGGHAGRHAARLPADYGDVPRRDLGLVASEGRVTLPVADGSAAGVLAVDAGFYEFVPEDAMETRDTGAPPTLLAHELEMGRRYDVLLTGDNGLYRYDLNDIVEVQGFHRGTPLLAFVRKGHDMTSITGEKLHLNHVQAAVREAECLTGVAVWQFRLIPDVDACRYDLLIEPRDGGLDAIGAEAFARAVDEALARINVEYAAKRRSRRLGLPRLSVMRDGWAERQCRAEFARGGREVQHKWAVIRAEWNEASRAEVVRAWEGKAE
jgi:GH3 auxin-responsive promoter